MNLGLWLVAVLGGVFALSLAFFLFLTRRSSPFHRAVGASLAATGVAELGRAMSLTGFGSPLAWSRLALTAEFAFATTFFYAGLSLVGSEDARTATTAPWRRRVVALVGVVGGLAVWSNAVWTLTSVGDGALLLRLGPLGRFVVAALVLSLVVGMAQAESILRSARDPLRYRLKYVLVGLGALAGYQIYESSQLLLFSAWQPQSVWVGALASWVSVGLVALGLGRSHLKMMTEKVTVSPRLLYGSLSFLVVGVYLVGIGLVGQLIRLSGQPYGVGLSTLIVFFSVLGLVIALLSRSARVELRNFVSRHFYESKHDYRAKWREVTDAFGGFGSVDFVLDRFLEILTRTFGAGRISIWLRYDADGRYHQVRSANTEPAPEPLGFEHPVVARLLESNGPIEVPLEGDGRETGDEFSRTTRASWCMPIRSGLDLLGFVALSRERGGAYGTDDADLLRAVTHHVGVLLSHAGMAEERRSAAGLEALHRFSAFCIHDLKNLASSLSLVVQNAERHGTDPAFQESAMKTVTGTLRKMTDLIQKLSLKSTARRLLEPVDVSEVIAETLHEVNGRLPGGVEVKVGGGPVPAVVAVREDLQQVLLNLVLNALQAVRHPAGPTVNTEDKIQVQIDRCDDAVWVTVSDHGPGIPSDELRTLFQPLRTSKVNGWGIGLYQCKEMIESQGGCIRVESKAGQGTSVRIELPLWKESESDAIANEAVNAKRHS